jgi:MFS family permease
LYRRVEIVVGRPARSMIASDAVRTGIDPGPAPEIESVRTTTSTARVVVALCLAEVASMAAFSTYPALLPVIRDAWGLDNSAAGLVSGIYFGGYMAAVPFLSSLTDRVDARRVYALSALVSAAGAAGFGLFAQGQASALAWQAVAGAGLAGTYMPGLKLLADRVEGPIQSRAISFYTSTFGLGGSFSLWLAGRLGSAFGWQWAFGLAACGPVAAAAVVLRTLPSRPVALPSGGPGPLRDLARLATILRNRAALVFIGGYAAHCWELFGVRAWMVAFLAYASASDPDHRLPWAAATMAAVINLLGPPASILGNELASRAGRVRYVAVVMSLSVAAAAVVGFTASWSWSLAFAALAAYFTIVMADSAALTAGVVAAARPAERGATMAAYSVAGFGAAFVSPLAFGAALDGAGGGGTAWAWGVAFASLAVPTLLALLMLPRWRAG